MLLSGKLRKKMNSSDTNTLQSNRELANEATGLMDSNHLAWYVASTRANHEKRVALELEEREVEHFLPVYNSVRRWKDRRVCLQLPLFPGYVFARFALSDRLKVLKIPSVARLVGFNGSPTALPDEEMQALKSGLSGALHAEPYPYLRTGCRIRLKSGPFKGLEGILRKKKAGYRLVISMELIKRSVAVEVDAADIDGYLFRDRGGDLLN
jgi:transcription antitermination factor NusG